MAAAAVLGASGCGKREATTVMPSTKDDSQPVIWVGDKSISQGELRAEIGRLERGIPEGLQGDALLAMRKQVVDRAIENTVMRQVVREAYERSGMVISRDEVEQAKRALFGKEQSDEALAILLAESNMTIPQLEDTLKLDIFRNRTLKTEVEAARAEVTDEAVRAYYDERLESEFTKPAGRTLSHILVKVEPEAGEEAKEAARQKAESIRAELLAGADFAETAKEKSDCPSKQQGGMLGFVAEGQGEGPFVEAAFSQEAGEIGAVVETPAGFHVIRVDTVEPKEVLDFDEVKGRIRWMLTMRAQQAVGQAYVEQLKKEYGVRFDGPLASLNQSGNDAPADAAGEGGGAEGDAAAGSGD